MSTAREQILHTTCALLEAQGYHATGLNQIVAESGAPKGSLYYYFPEGKEELAAEAITRTGQQVARRIRTALAEHDDVGEAVRAFIYTIAHYVEASEYRSGGPLATVAMETATASERLNRACRHAYRLLQDAFQERLLARGYTEVRAERLALFIVSSIEGGTVLSRTNHSGDPLRQVGDELANLLA